MAKKISLFKASPSQMRVAFMNYHYAKSVPAVQIAFSCFEDNEFIGVIAYSGGDNNNSAKSFGLKQGQLLELVRVALNGKQENPTSKFVALSMKLVKKHKPLVKVLISYADKTNQGHAGTIYKATNWLYYGERSTNKGAYYKINGKIIHGRSARAKYGRESNFPVGWQDVPTMVKHLFVYPLNEEMRQKLKSKALPYQGKEGGAVPTLSHQELTPELG